jgi:tetratricopeptide (TPR) repeat protein
VGSFFRRHKYRDISLPPQWSPTRQGPVASIEFAQTLGRWMTISNIREARRFLETHRELLDPASEILIGFSIRQNANNAIVEYEHLDILREVKARGKTIREVREAYVDIYNGLRALDVPPWLEDRQKQFLLVKGNPLQEAMALVQPLRETIVRAQHDPSVAPEVLAVLQAWLGDELLALLGPNLSETIALWKAALNVYTFQRYPRRYADLHLRLGSVYLNITSNEQDPKVEEVNQAISSFQGALQVYTRSEFPEEWARSQAGLGASYITRGEQKRAKKYLEQALEVFTSKEYPDQWGFIQEALKQLTEGYSSSDALSFLYELRKKDIIGDKQLNDWQKEHRKKEF